MDLVRGQEAEHLLGTPRRTWAVHEGEEELDKHALIRLFNLHLVDMFSFNTQLSC